MLHYENLTDEQMDRLIMMHENLTDEQMDRLTDEQVDAYLRQKEIDVSKAFAALQQTLKNIKAQPKRQVMKTCRVEEYEICGNEFLAIAININDPEDAHTFEIDPEVHNDAFAHAQTWAAPGI